ncbi:MAG TPA: hypothetical protein VG799_00385 [Gemmatimonadota bacterium]|nr:hypothetical protein [Gemmatimonadota bacterium]
MTAARGQKNEERPARLSYLTAGVSGTLVLALVAYLGVHAVGVDRPAAIVTETVPREAWEHAGVRYVPVDVSNLGDRPATEVVIEAGPDGTGPPETVTIDYLAGGERKRIYIALPNGSAEGPVTARVATFQEP